MTTLRWTSWVLVAVAIEVAVFQYAYHDLIWLNRPVAELQAAPLDAVAPRVQSALAREHLTRQHLETMAAATAAQPTLLDDHVTALERLHRRDPRDLHLHVRLADAYRRAGRLDAARALLTEVLESTRP